MFGDITVLSVEQALALPFCTYRLVQDGMNVYKLESPKGDPNRYVASKFNDEDDMGTYFLGVNAGKKSITLNLQHPESQDIFRELIDELDVDVFTCNVRPDRYEKLGIDYETLKGIKNDIIWLGISGRGPEYPEPAYDPMIQAEWGLMDINGPKNGPPELFGISIADIRTGEVASREILKSLYIREKTGEGRRIDASMVDAMASLYVTKIPLQNAGYEIRRNGSSHKFFTPVSRFKTKDDYLMIVVGNQRQWKALTTYPQFESLNREEYSTNNDRMERKDQLYAEMGEITKQMETEEISRICKDAGIPVGRIRIFDDMLNDPYIQERIQHIEDPKTSKKVLLAPTPIHNGKLNLSFPPRLGEHNKEVYESLLGHNLDELKEQEII